jgi:hypothetical protein
MTSRAEIAPRDTTWLGDKDRGRWLVVQVARVETSWCPFRAKVAAFVRAAQGAGWRRKRHTWRLPSWSERWGPLHLPTPLEPRNSTLCPLSVKAGVRSCS